MHLAPSELPGAVGALARVLVPGRVLAVAVHTGADVHRADELFGAAVDVDFVRHDREEVLTAFAGAGLADVEWYLRSSAPGVEVDAERLYVLGRTP